MLLIPRKIINKQKSKRFDGIFYVIVEINRVDVSITI